MLYFSYNQVITTVELNLYKIQICESIKDAHNFNLGMESQDEMSKTKSFCYNF